MKIRLRCLQFHAAFVLVFVVCSRAAAEAATINAASCSQAHVQAAVNSASDDVFFNNGAKPGYSKYTYPHPLR